MLANAFLLLQACEVAAAAWSYSCLAPSGVRDSLLTASYGQRWKW